MGEGVIIVVTIVVTGTMVVVGRMFVIVGNTCEVSVNEVVGSTVVNASMLVMLGDAAVMVKTGTDVTAVVKSLNTGPVVVGTSITLELTSTLVSITTAVVNVGVGEMISVASVSPVMVVVLIMSLDTSEGVNMRTVVVGVTTSLLSGNIIVTVVGIGETTVLAITPVTVGGALDGINVEGSNTSLPVGVITEEKTKLVVSGRATEVTLGRVDAGGVVIGTKAVVSTSDMDGVIVTKDTT